MDKELLKKAEDLLSSISYLEDKRKKVEQIKRSYNYGVDFGTDSTHIGCLDDEDIFLFCDYLIDKYSKQIDKLKKEFEEL